MFYAGDGVSDLSAARETDLLFAKKGHGELFLPKPMTVILTYPSSPDLIRYCVKENVPFTVFEDWSTILEKVKAIVEGKTTVQEAAEQGYEEYKRGMGEANGHAG